MRLPVSRLSWWKRTFSRSDVAGKSWIGHDTSDRRRYPFQYARGAMACSPPTHKPTGLKRPAAATVPACGSSLGARPGGPIVAYESRDSDPNSRDSSRHVPRERPSMPVGADLVPQDLVALAAALQEPRPVDDRDRAAAILDQAVLLEFGCRNRDGRPPHPQHVGQEFLREVDLLALDEILRLEEPAAQPALERVQRMACRILLRLAEDKRLVAVDAIAQLAVFEAQRAELRRADAERVALDLHHGLGKGRQIAYGETADQTFAADDAGLDRFARRRHGHQRHHPRQREIDLRYRPPGFLENERLRQVDRGEMLFEIGPHLCGERLQNQIVGRQEGPRDCTRAELRLEGMARNCTAARAPEVKEILLMCRSASVPTLALFPV